MKRVRLESQVEAFNVFNSDAIVSYRSVRFGTAAYQQPSGVLQGRIIGIGMQAWW